MDETLIIAWANLCDAIIAQAEKDIIKDLENQNKKKIKLSTVKRHATEKRYAVDASEFLNSDYAKTLLDYVLWADNMADIGLALKLVP